MFMQDFKKIDHTLTNREILQYLEGLVWLYQKDCSKKLPDYFGNNPYISVGNNEKTQGFANVNLAALVTCLFGMECRKYCYATCGNYQFDSTEISRVNNTMLYINNPAQYEEQLTEELANIGLPIRWNDSGDLIDYNYFCMIVRIALATGLRCHLFTKKMFYVNRYCRENNVNNEWFMEHGIYIQFSEDKAIVNMHNPYGFKLAGITSCDIDNLTEYTDELERKTFVCNDGKCNYCKRHNLGCFDPSINRVLLFVHGSNKGKFEE